MAAMVAAVTALPRHKSREFLLPGAGFIGKLERLMMELDDIGEFVGLETEGRSFVLTIRHR